MGHEIAQRPSLTLGWCLHRVEQALIGLGVAQHGADLVPGLPRGDDAVEQGVLALVAHQRHEAPPLIPGRLERQGQAREPEAADVVVEVLAQGMPGALNFR